MKPVRLSIFEGQCWRVDNEGARQCETRGGCASFIDDDRRAVMESLTRQNPPANVEANVSFANKVPT